MLRIGSRLAIEDYNRIPALATVRLDGHTVCDSLVQDLKIIIDNAAMAPILVVDFLTFTGHTMNTELVNAFKAEGFVVKMNGEEVIDMYEMIGRDING